MKIPEKIELICFECKAPFSKRKNDYSTALKWGKTKFRCPRCRLKFVSKQFNRDGYYSK